MRLLQTPGLADIWAALPGARLVGGCVRDALAAQPITDIDIAAPFPPEEVLSRLEAAGLRVIPTGLAHGTVTALCCGREFEITTLRRDVATDGRHAVVAWTDDFAADAARRDFTINAMSMDADGRVFDYFGGQADLAAGRVRFVGDAATRITEDYLRILRFFRFFARYGRAPADAQALAAIEQHRAGLAGLSAERVWSELKRLLAWPTPLPALHLMEQSGVRALLLPEAVRMDRLARQIAAGGPAEALVRLAAWIAGPSEALGARLKFSNAEQDSLARFSTGPVADPADSAALRRLWADEAGDILVGRAWVHQPERAAALAQALQGQARPIFPLEGRHALALGAKQGPEIGAALQRVRAWWLADGARADLATCSAMLARELASPTRKT